MLVEMTVLAERPDGIIVYFRVNLIAGLPLRVHRSETNTDISGAILTLCTMSNPFSLLTAFMILRNNFGEAEIVTEPLWPCDLSAFQIGS